MMNTQWYPMIFRVEYPFGGHKAPGKIAQAQGTLRQRSKQQGLAGPKAQALLQRLAPQSRDFPWVYHGFTIDLLICYMIYT